MASERASNDSHDASGAALPSPGGEAHPERIGPYRILRVLGEGGMGVVYLAEQGEPVRREVALKILKLGMDTKQVVARFESERQALAVMEHPGIAKVYDAGATEAGRPYFVMERVDGVPITDYCDSQHLPLRERVRLFCQVCRAVQHAHQKGVIHRDLKPSNVLVTTSGGEPLCKIIDFGIAKAVEQRLTEHTLVTQVDQAMGTPAYMSPEQAAASGLDVDTRSDIYSLGVLLYELLAGALPFNANAYQGWGFIAHHIASDPPRPSARIGQLAEGADQVAEGRGTDVASLRRELGGDLDWIVLRAMEKERGRRYETASALSADLERYLADEPVSARPPSRGYRARKFVRRHRAGVAFAATLVLVLAGFAGTMTVQANRIARARAAALLRQGQAEDLIGFMVGDLRQKLTPLGRLDVLDDVGQKALEYFAAVPESELSGEELYRRSEAMRQLGEVRLEQGRREAALEAFHEALRMARVLAARDPRNGEWQLGLGASHYWVGYTQYFYGGYDSALEQFTAYRRVAEGLVARRPDSLTYRLELSYAQNNVGSVLEAKGDLEPALRAYEATLDAKRFIAEREPGNAGFQRALANSHNKMAVILRKVGQLDRALEHQRAELGIREALVAGDSTNAPALQLLTFAHSFLGELLAVKGEGRAAGESRLTALRLSETLVARDPDNARWRRTLGVTARWAGLGLAESGQGGEGVRRLGASRASFAQLLARDTANLDLRQELAESETALAAGLRLTGRTAESLAAAERAVRMLDALAGSRPEDQEIRRLQAEAHLERGRALARGGRERAARDAWALAVAAIEPIARTSGNTDHLAPLALALLYLDRDEDAAAPFRELSRRGFRSAGLHDLARAKGLIP